MSQSRVFIGLPLSDEARRGVEEVMKTLVRKHWQVRWEEPEKWHVTLAFLGRVSQASQVSRVVWAGTAGIQRFTLRFKGLGRFPESRRVPQYGERISGRMAKPVRLRGTDILTTPKIIWLGLRGDLKALYRLQRGVVKELGLAGLPFDKKTFRPHITLGRIKAECPRGQRLQMAEEIEKMYEMEIPQEWVVDRVAVYESVLHPSGSEYRVLETGTLQY